MARKSNLKRYPTIVDGDMSGNITSTVTNIEWLDNIGVQINFSGRAVGNFEVEVSMDYDQDINGNVINPGNWVSIPLSNNSIDIPTSLAAPIYVDLNELSAPWIRVIYIATSNTGTANVFICGKVL